MSLNKARLLKALIRNDLRAFVQKSFATLCPGQTYIPTWHIEAIAWQLMRVLNGEVKRLIINMPPRSLKSIMASVALPAFALGHDPTRRIICVSYSGDLAKNHSNDFRAVMDSSWYKAAFPTARVGDVKDTESEIKLTASGFRLASSVGGSLTGRGGNLIIIDDPLKAEDAMSEVKREAANHWYMNTLLSRLDDKRTGAIIVVMQRVHMDDMTGFLLGQSDEWEVLSLPAIAYHDEIIRVAADRTYSRKAGEALSPEREPLYVLDALKLQYGSDVFSAQYQQSPVPPGGAMVKRDWVKRYSELPPVTERRQVLQSWDTASKGGPDNDWSVCTTFIFHKSKSWYLADVWRKRVDYPALKTAVQDLAKRWSARRVLVEDTGAGTALVQELRGEVLGITAVKPKGDKASRMAVASAKFEAGLVYFPEKASWLPDLEAELFAFPGSRHDDQCDAISQVLQETNLLPWWEQMPPDEWQRLCEWAKTPSRY